MEGKDLEDLIHFVAYRMKQSSICSVFPSHATAAETCCGCASSTLLFVFLREQGLAKSLCSPRAQYGFLETGILIQKYSFERRLRGAAPTPLTLPYPFRTST